MWQWRRNRRSPLPDFTKELLQKIMTKRVLVTLFVSFQLFAIAAGAAVVTQPAVDGVHISWGDDSCDPWETCEEST